MTTSSTTPKVNEGESPRAGSWYVAGMAAFFVLIVVIGVIYVDFNDRLNADNAYRTTELRRQRDSLKAECDKNFESMTVLQEWIRQQPGLKPPPGLMFVKECTQLTPAEKLNKE